MNEYIVRSGNGYVCEDRGLELPLMTSAREDALRHSFRDARDRILNMRELHGIECEACLLPLSNNAVRGAAEPRTLDGLVGSSEVPK